MPVFSSSAYATLTSPWGITISASIGKTGYRLSDCSLIPLIDMQIPWDNDSSIFGSEKF